MKFRPYAPAFLSAAMSLALLGACSSSDNKAAPAATDAGAKTPETAEEVPAVRLEGDKSTCPGAYGDTAPVAGLNKSFSIDGQSREFVLILPPDSFTGPRPLFMGFNGTGETGPSFTERAGLQDFADAGFIVLAPSSKGNGTIWPVWDGMRTDKDMDAPNKDMDFVDALLSCTAAHFEVDKNRLYIGGHSAGGIFTNYVAQRRSEILAGAIPASGIFSSTSPVPEKDLDKMFVLVTWGGDNDKFTGSTGLGGVSVPEANFVSEASIATKFYAAQANIGEANCRGKNLGHAWLPINDWFVKVLLEHPKGFPGTPKPELPEVTNSKVTCTTDVFDYKGASVTCGASTTDGCQQACQLFGDCGVANGTVGGALKPQFTAIGFNGTDCGGCVTKCEANADAAVLSCMKKQQATAQCGDGIAGATPLIEAINTCCDGKKTSSPYCKLVCDAIAQSSVAINYFTACQ
jgi:poly(3-hydroxybutyrate) depolymerase